MMGKTRKMLFLICILTVAYGLPSFACNCESEATVTNSVKSSEVIISGQVISRTLTTNYDSLGIAQSKDDTQSYLNWRKYPITIVRIKVEQWFKGKAVSDTITILTSSSASACGFYFQVGQKYIVYGTATDNMLGTNEIKSNITGEKTYWTNQCSRTQFWNKAEENDLIIETQ